MMLTHQLIPRVMAGERQAEVVEIPFGIGEEEDFHFGAAFEFPGIYNIDHRNLDVITPAKTRTLVKEFIFRERRAYRIIGG